MVEKAGRVLFVRLDLLFAKNLVHDPAVGSTRDFNSIEVIRDPELVLQDIPQRLEAGAGGIDQGSVDVEKEQPFGN